MKLLIATPLYPPEIGGPATYTKLLEEELPKRGVAVLVAPFGSVRRFPKGIRHCLYAIKLIRLGSKADIIFAQDTVSVGFPALIASKILGKKFLVRVPGDHAWEQGVQRFCVKDSLDAFQTRKYGWRVETLRYIERTVVRRADLVIAPSRYFSRLVSQWGPSLRVETIYNGIATPAMPASVRKKRIISIGRLVAWKGFEGVIKLMQILPGWELMIVGDGPERGRLIRRVEELGLSERVNIVGSKSREEALSMLSSSEIFILNTSFESFSFQTVEAMQLGTPVITTNVGSLPELIENNKEGILVSPDNLEEMKNAVLQLSEDLVFRESVTNAAKKKAEHFTIQKTADAFTDKLKELHI